MKAPEDADVEWVAVVVALALLEYVFFAIQVGRARGRTGVKAPATTGSEEFERYFRVQSNTTEQLVIFLPGIFLFSHFVSAPLAAVLGAVFVVGRALYYQTYTVDPARRSAGFALSMLPNLALVLGGLFGALRTALAS